VEDVDPADRQRIDNLFRLSADDRSKGFEPKHELDQLGMFQEYEDRFLDLFKGLNDAKAGVCQCRRRPFDF
jgi:hypothetical protein